MPFEIPESWVWTTLGNIGQWQSGATLSRLCKEYYGGTIPWLKTGDLNDGYIYDIPEYITEKALAETSVKLNPVGSILIAMYGATIGKVGMLTFPATTNQACCACVDYSGIEQKYLFYFLVSHKEEFIMQSGGGAQPNISKEKIVETLIPIPPRPEQVRIVNIIENWFAIIDKIEQEQVDLTCAIKQTKSKILDIAIHGKLVPQDPNDEPAIDLLRRINPDFKPCDNAHYKNLPKGWELIKVGNLAKYTNGKAFKPSDWEVSGLPIVRIQNLNDITCKYNYTTLIHEEKFKIKKGDLLFAWAASLGVYIWQYSDAWLNQHIFKVEPYAFIDKQYIYYLFQYLIADFYTKSHGSGMVHITKSEFENTMAILPPINEQRRIVNAISRYNKLIESIIAEL